MTALKRGLLRAGAVLSRKERQHNIYTLRGERFVLVRSKVKANHVEQHALKRVRALVGGK